MTTGAIGHKVEFEPSVLLQDPTERTSGFVADRTSSVYLQVIVTRLTVILRRAEGYI